MRMFLRASLVLYESLVFFRPFCLFSLLSYPRIYMHVLGKMSIIETEGLPNIWVV